MSAGKKRGGGDRPASRKPGGDLMGKGGPSRGRLRCVVARPGSGAPGASSTAKSKPSWERLRGAIVVVKYGGAAMDDGSLSEAWARDVAALAHGGVQVVVVHGGGATLSRTLGKLGIESAFVGGQRVTSAEAAEVAQMVLSGRINKQVVSLLGRAGAPAIGLSGSDAGLLKIRPYRPEGRDLGFVGEVERVEIGLLRLFLSTGYIPVISSTSTDEGGSAYNINADFVAGAVAAALGAAALVFLSDTEGVIVDGRKTNGLDANEARSLLDDEIAAGGMRPKLEAALAALERGVSQVRIADGRQPGGLLAALAPGEGHGTLLLAARSDRAARASTADLGARSTARPAARTTTKPAAHTTEEPATRTTQEPAATEATAAPGAVRGNRAPTTPYGDGMPVAIARHGAAAGRTGAERTATDEGERAAAGRKSVECAAAKWIAKPAAGHASAESAPTARRVEPPNGRASIEAAASRGSVMKGADHGEERPAAPRWAGTLASRGAASLMGTYKRYPIEVAAGRGCRVTDSAGRSYLDFVAGIAVSVLGHAHPTIVSAIRTAADGLLHASNLYWTEPMVRLAERLTRAAEMDRAFFCNSGAEAVEAALKLARRARPGRTQIIAFDRSFHGRTLGALSATAQPHYQDPFRPLLPGIRTLPFGDFEAVGAAVDAGTAAVIVEPIQGEGGVRPAPEGWLVRVRQACDSTGALLILDEVQTGLGRTGSLYAYQSEGVLPDAVASAKALAGGLPMGVMMARGEAATAFKPGDHASTFGGGPLVASVANAVLDVLLEPGFLEDVRAKGAHLERRLRAVAGRSPALVREVRGRGLIWGLELTREMAPALVGALHDMGLLTLPAGTSVLRLLPPLTVARDEIDEATESIGRALAEIEAATVARGPSMVAASDGPRAPSVQAAAACRPSEATDSLRTGAAAAEAPLPAGEAASEPGSGRTAAAASRSTPVHGRDRRSPSITRRGWQKACTSRGTGRSELESLRSSRSIDDVAGLHGSERGPIRAPAEASRDARQAPSETEPRGTPRGAPRLDCAPLSGGSLPPSPSAPAGRSRER